MLNSHKHEEVIMNWKKMLFHQGVKKKKKHSAIRNHSK